MSEVQYTLPNFLAPKDAWDKLPMKEKAEMIKVGVRNGIYDPKEIRQRYNEFAKGGYTVEEAVDAIYQSSPEEEFLGEPEHHYDFTQSEEWANAHGYYPDARGHRDDRVKKPAHPSHPSRGAWDRDKFVLTDIGMQTPNYTLFGLNDGGQDPQATLVYDGGVVLPEFTITPKGNYIDNTYDNIRLHYKAIGGPIVETANHYYDGISENTQQMEVVPDNTYVTKQPVLSAIPKKGFDWEEAAINRANQVYSNYDEAKDEPLGWANTKIRNTLRWLQDRNLNPLGSGVSNCTLSATQWVDPNMPIKGAASIHKNPEKYNYSSIDSLDIVPGNLIITKVPNKDSYHTMMVSGFAGQDSTVNFRGKNYPVKKGEPLMTYSRGGHDNSFIQRNIPLSVYTANSDGHTENMFYRYNYPREVFLPEIIVKPKKKRK